VPFVIYLPNNVRVVSTCWSNWSC